MPLSFFGALVFENNIAPQHRFGVALGFEHRAVWRELSPQFGRIVNFAVVNDGVFLPLVGNRHRLSAVFRVHDAEPVVVKRHRLVTVAFGRVRTAVFHRHPHMLYQIAVGPAAVIDHAAN